MLLLEVSKRKTTNSSGHYATIIIVVLLFTSVSALVTEIHSLTFSSSAKVFPRALLPLRQKQSIGFYNNACPHGYYYTRPSTKDSSTSSIHGTANSNKDQDKIIRSKFVTVQTQQQQQQRRRRREFLQGMSVLSCFISFRPPISWATSSTSSSLFVLPSKSPHCIRLYLCRHGQTENNRLHLVQGARVDASLNDVGKQQAQLLGRALSRLNGNNNNNLLFLHSKLKRSKETASVAAATVYPNTMLVHIPFNSSASSISSELTNNNTIANSSDITTANSNNTTNFTTLQLLPSINEIDFGRIEGKSSASVRSEMFHMYSSWSVGLLDVKSSVDDIGENGREVIERVVQSFHSIVQLSNTSSTATTNNQPQNVVAVSHGQFIRMMLAIALDMPLYQALTTLQQMNGCMNVLDISTTENVTIVGKKSKIFGGPFLSRLTSDDDFRIVVPKINVLCINDIRHLEEYI